MLWRAVACFGWVLGGGARVAGARGVRVLGGCSGVRGARVSGAPVRGISVGAVAAAAVVAAAAGPLLPLRSQRRQGACQTLLTALHSRCRAFTLGAVSMPFASTARWRRRRLATQSSGRDRAAFQPTWPHGCRAHVQVACFIGTRCIFEMLNWNKDGKVLMRCKLTGPERSESPDETLETRRKPYLHV